MPAACVPAMPARVPAPAYRAHVHVLVAGRGQEEVNFDHECHTKDS